MQEVTNIVVLKLTTLFKKSIVTIINNYFTSYFLSGWQNKTAALLLKQKRKVEVVRNVKLIQETLVKKELQRSLLS